MKLIFNLQSKTDKILTFFLSLQRQKSYFHLFIRTNQITKYIDTINLKFKKNIVQLILQKFEKYTFDYINS